MDNAVIAALGALGAWLLVAGPLHQASKELTEQGRSGRGSLPPDVPPPSPISGWWWLLPPVAYILHRAQRERLRRAMVMELPEEDVRKMLAFSSTAVGWLLVAGGASLIAVKETWEFVEIAHWPEFTTWIFVGTAVVLSAGNAVLSVLRDEKVLSVARAKGGGAPER